MVQLQGDIGIFSSVVTCGFQWHLIEGQLLDPFACHVFKVNRFSVQIESRQGIHIVPGSDAVQHIGLQHRVVYWPLYGNTVASQHAHVVLQILSDLGDGGIFQHRLQGL